MQPVPPLRAYFYMRVILVLILLTFLHPCSGSAQEPIKGYYPFEHNGMPYRMWGDKGDGPEPYSVVIYLHGAGEKGNDNQRQVLQGSDIIDSVTSYLERTQKRCLVVVPQCPFGRQWVNTDWTQGSYNSEAAGFSAELQNIVDLLLDLRNRKRINVREIYLMGSSMGGYGVWDLLQREPDQFAAAVPICGAADTSRAAQIAKTPVWTFHAEGDLVVPVSGTREIVQRLEVLDAPIRYTEYTFEPHIVWPRVAREPELLDWMFSNVRSESSVLFHTRGGGRICCIMFISTNCLYQTANGNELLSCFMITLGMNYFGQRLHGSRRDRSRSIVIYRTYAASLH